MKFIWRGAVQQNMIFYRTHKLQRGTSLAKRDKYISSSTASCTTHVVRSHKGEDSQPAKAAKGAASLQCSRPEKPCTKSFPQPGDERDGCQSWGMQELQRSSWVGDDNSLPAVPPAPVELALAGSQQLQTLPQHPSSSPPHSRRELSGDLLPQHSPAPCHTNHTESCWEVMHSLTATGCPPLSTIKTNIQQAVQHRGCRPKTPDPASPLVHLGDQFKYLYSRASTEIILKTHQIPHVQ